jgi:PAS domain S-box-containing protein
LEDEKVIQNNTSVGALQQKLLDVKDKLKQLGLIEVKSFTPKVLMNEYAEVIWVNDAWEQYTGYTLDDVRGIQPGDLLYGADTIPDARETTNEKLSNKQIFSFESILYNKAKEPFWTRVILEPIVDGNGVLIGQMATMEDIAEAKRLEAEFKEQELLWKVTMEETGHGFWETDFRNNKYYFSRQLKILLGYEDEDAFDLSTWQAALSPADRQYLEDTVLASLTEASPRFATEIKLGTKSGNNKFYLLKGRVLDWDEYKKPRRIAGTLMDINERMAKDIELRRTSATLKALLKNLNEGVLLVDEHEHIIVANEAFAELFETEINADDLEGVDSNLVFEGGGSRYFEHPEEQEARTKAILENKLKVVAEQLQLTNSAIHLKTNGA